MFPWEQVIFDEGEEVAWHVWNGPGVVWRGLPTFLVFEWVVFLTSLLGLLHALSQPASKGRRGHLFLWLCSFVAGCANDVFFMALPVVDNFWQAQATIMLTPRLPLYIPAVYNCFMYYSVVAAWRLGFAGDGGLWGYVKEGALAGLLAELFYSAYDICGAKFLWWTWHDTDAAIASRLLGVPIGSSMWVITFVFCYSVLLRLVVFGRRPLADHQGEPPHALRLVVGLALISALCPPLMVVVMSTFTVVASGGVPSLPSLALLLVVFVALVLSGYAGQRATPPHGRRNAFLWLAVLVYFVSLALIMMFGVPHAHISRGIHQPIGPPTAMMTDMLGFERRKFFDPADFDEDFTFDCVQEIPRHGSADDPLDWYTVCGKRHTNFVLYASAVAAIAFVGVLVYTYALGLYSVKPEKAADQQQGKKKKGQ